MEKQRKDNLLVIITNTFAAINVMHSGLLKNLEQKYAIRIISDLLTEADVVHMNRYFGTECQLIAARIPRIRRSLHWLRKIQKLLFLYAHNIETLHIKLAARCLVVSWLLRLGAQSAIATFLTKRLLTFLRRLIIRLTTWRTWPFQLHHHHLSGVVSTSPLDIRENAIINSLKINSIAIIISWDNLTSKGVINANHDLVIVWNAFMAEEYRRFYGDFGATGKVAACGIPRFDRYFGKNCLHEPIIRFRQALPIPPGNRIILFATSASRHIQSQSYMMEHIVEYANARRNISILVRCHSGDDPANYAGFAIRRNVHVLSPFDSVVTGGSVPPADFLDSLHIQLLACDVCIQVASTMRLDGAACNKPVISIAYDANIDRHSVARLYRYSHQLPLNALAIDYPVHSKQELFETLDRILAHNGPARDYGKSISAFTHHTKPESVRLVTEHIRKCIN